MADEKEKQPKQIQIANLPETKPFFADNVFINPILQEFGKNRERDATIDMIFTNKNFAVSNIRITVEHAKAFAQLLLEKIDESEKFRKTGKRPELQVPKTSADIS